MLPARRVKFWPREAVEPRPLRIARDVEQTECGHDGVELRDGAVGSSQRVKVALVVPHGRRNGGIETQMGREVEAVDHGLDVGLNLGLGCVRARPVVRHERVGIERDLDIALGAGIAIVPPGAAWSRGFFEDRKRRDAGAFQPHGGGNAAEAGSDDGDGLRGNFRHVATRMIVLSIKPVQYLFRLALR